LVIIDGVVLCTAKDQGHVHGACQNGVQFCFSIYSSDTGAWGHVISLPWALQNEGFFLNL
jgi:hypothetical protein